MEGRNGQVHEGVIVIDTSGPGRLLTAWLLARTLGLAAMVHAASLGDMQSQGRQLGVQLKQLRASNRLDTTAEQGLAKRLGELVTEFVEQSDGALRTGSERQRHTALRAAFEALHEPLDDLYKTRSGRMNRMARAVMDEDGDLEALYETPEWQESQAVAAQALYFLNWLNYYGAQLVEGVRRKELLDAAENGFSEFAVGDQRNDLLVESLLGRGLCHLDLGNQEWAQRDFRLVIDEPGVSAERKAKAQLALLDSYSRAGNVREALRYSSELLRAESLPREDIPLVRFYRLQALFDALNSAAGEEKETYRREVGKLMDRLRRSGKEWGEKVDALMAARIDDPSRWIDDAKTPRAQWELAKLLLKEEDYEGAEPFLEEIVENEGADARMYHPEAHYWLGVARFKAGEYAAAARQLDTALGAAERAFAADAMYLRFKALEAMMADGEGTPELAERYAASLRELLEQHPDQPLAFEAHYRLAEYRQASGDFAGAIEEYAKVSGNPGFELRARFGALQSAFELLRGESDSPRREALLTSIGEDLERFWKQTKSGEAVKDLGDVQLQEFKAKATLLQAVYLSLGGYDNDEEVVAVLADYGQRFPEQEEILPQALRLRLAALRRLDRFAEAAGDVARHAEALRQEGRPEALRALASGFAKASARTKAAGDAAGAEAASRVALRLYEISNGSDGPASTQQWATIARLHESTGNWDAAAAIYRELAGTDAGSLVALRGLARVEEARHNTAGALGYWAAYTEKVQPGGAGWFRGRYEQARLTLASGDRKGSCAILTELRAAVRRWNAAQLREPIGRLYTEACD